MKGKSIKEIQSTKQQIRADKFRSTLTLVFIFLKQNRQAIIELPDKKEIHVIDLSLPKLKTKYLALITKPTGSGTGLGLSLSYDIVKAHGGEITVKSDLNSFTEFNIKLPVVL